MMRAVTTEISPAMTVPLSVEAERAQPYVLYRASVRVFRAGAGWWAGTGGRRRAQPFREARRAHDVDEEEEAVFHARPVIAAAHDVAQGAAADEAADLEQPMKSA
jgi:hypothetical protein